MAGAYHPGCDAMVDVADSEIGDHLACSACNVKLQAISKLGKPGERQFIICPGCGIELDIVSVDPFEVDFTEDW